MAIEAESAGGADVDGRIASVIDAAALQRSLLPTRLPVLLGLEFAARYLPGGEGVVGGDWYDVFTLPGGMVAIAIGDVVGRGLQAAVVMGRVRSAMRAYALEVTDPAVVLERLDRKLQHFEVGQMATVFYAVVDPSSGRALVSSAGHPIPLVASPGRLAESVDAPVDPPLGVVPAFARRSTVVDLQPGEILVLFTDGLVERRGASIDERLQRLRGAIDTTSAADGCASAVAAMVGEGDNEDDVAVLCVRRPSDLPGLPLHLDLVAVPASLGRVRTAVRQWMASLGITEEEGFPLLVVVGEACADAIEHAYGAAGGPLIVDVSFAEPNVLVAVRDNGQWRSQRGQHRGRGLMVMEKWSDELDVERTPEGTEVRFRWQVRRDDP